MEFIISIDSHLHLLGGNKKRVLLCVKSRVSDEWVGLRNSSLLTYHSQGRKTITTESYFTKLIDSLIK